MTTDEFSNEFDTLLYSYADTADVESLVLDEYEKSVYLTKSEEDIVQGLYNGTLSATAFEGTEALRSYLDPLVTTSVISTQETGYEPISDKSVFYKVPLEAWYVIYESVKFNDEALGCANGTVALVYPTTHDEFNRVKKNPFRGPDKSRVLRLNINNNIVEIVSNYTIENYTIRYIRAPKPIILTYLPESDINGIKEKTECELNPVLHRLILTSAVTMALKAKAVSQAPRGAQQQRAQQQQQ